MQQITLNAFVLPIVSNRILSYVLMVKMGKKGNPLLPYPLIIISPFTLTFALCLIINALGKYICVNVFRFRIVFISLLLYQITQVAFMASRTRLKGSNILLDTDTYNTCFSAYFGLSIIDVLQMAKHSDLQLIYYYGLRRMCGLSVRAASELLGFPNSFAVSYALKFCCKKLCKYDTLHSPDFVMLWGNFLKYCRHFRTPLTNAERSRRFRAKQRNKKTRKK